MSSKLLLKNVGGDLRYGIFLQPLCRRRCVLCSTLGDREEAEFMASFDTATEQGRLGKARMFGVANGMTLAWAPMAPVCRVA